MIKSVTVTNYIGESVKIKLTEDDPDHGWIIMGFDGISAPKADINTTEMATNDGSLFNSSRATERSITVSLLYTHAPRIEDARQRTYKYFPIKKPVELLFETDNRNLRIMGYVESNESDIFSEKESCQISLICPDPFFYSDKVNTTLFAGVDPLFEFIFSNESLDENLIEFGEIVNRKERTVYYDGDSDVGVTIRIHAIGEARNVEIFNVRTRESMLIDTVKLTAYLGHPIISGDDILIKTNRGEKSVTLIRNGYEHNILNCIGRDSDWFRLSKGDNIFTYIAEYGADHLHFTIENKVLFEGV